MISSIDSVQFYYHYIYKIIYLNGHLSLILDIYIRNTESKEYLSFNPFTNTCLNRMKIFDSVHRSFSSSGNF